MTDEKLLEMRCRCCGVFMGFRTRIGRFVFWCCEDCYDSPMSKWEESQIRDETVVAMFLDGQGIMEISKGLDNWPYQYVQQILARRGLQEWQANEYQSSTQEEETVPTHRLVRQKAS